MKKSFYLIVFALILSVTSCRTKEGAPGPAGESTLSKQGTISGTITYTDDNGNDATAPFNFQYFESLQDNVFSYQDNSQSQGPSYYTLDFGRRDLKDVNNYLYFYLQGNSMNGLEDAPYSISNHFNFITVINSEFYEFYGSGNNFVITNVNLDPTTGRITFEFTGTVLYNGGYSATITGSVDVTSNRKRVNNQVS
jgi:hypothetical protein